MIHGNCLCGGVQFEIQKISGPFELCHCHRCRKATGSAFYAGIYVNREDFRLLKGQEWIRAFEAPILEAPPAYRSCFCSRCGSPVPDLQRDSLRIEIPAGLLDNDPGVSPDRHIFVDCKSSWYEITDELPRLDREGLALLRKNWPT